MMNRLKSLLKNKTSDKWESMYNGAKFGLQSGFVLSSVMYAFQHNDTCRYPIDWIMFGSWNGMMVGSVAGLAWHYPKRSGMFITACAAAYAAGKYKNRKQENEMRKVS